MSGASVTHSTHAGAPHSPPRAGLSAWLWGHDPKLRAALQRTILAVFICLIWMAVEIDARRRGVLSGAALRGVLVFNAVGLLGFLTALRSGWSKRFRDPSLTQAQMVFAALSMSAAYALMPHTRAAALQVMCLTLVFGMFRLSPRQTRSMGWITSAVLLGTVGVLGVYQGAAFSLREDLVPAALACLIMQGISLVLSHFSRLREQLSEQRHALRDTLSQVEELAIRDSLTGLYNRRHTQHLVEQECLRHARSGMPLALALVDLDHFKHVNDTHGHHVGDDVLIAAARTMREQLRATDAIGRWGGEEFLLMLPDTPAESAWQVLERVRTALSGVRVSQTVPALRITFSAGIAEARGHAQPHKTLEQADQALYEAKAAGRNCCRMGGAGGH